MTSVTEVRGRYGPATAEIERLITRLENLNHSDWREIVASQDGHPPSRADRKRLAQAVAAARVSRESEGAVAMIREVVAAASAEVSMDPALDQMPVTQSSAVMSDVVRALAARSDLDVAMLAAFCAPLESVVPLSMLSAAPGYGTEAQATGVFIAGLARLDGAGWRQIEARRLSEKREPFARGARMTQTIRDATLACRRKGNAEAWLAASADARAAAARSWDLCHSDEKDAREREEVLRRAQLAGGCLAVREALAGGTCATLCSLFAGIVELPQDLAETARRADHQPTDRLYVRACRELRVPYEVLEAGLADPERLWAVVVGAREQGGRPNLEVGFGRGLTRVTHGVTLKVAAAVTDRCQTVFSIGWEPVGGAHFLPGFEGQLMVRARDASRSEVVIEGDYRPPLARLGRLLDQRLVHRVAGATLEDLVSRVVSAMVEV